MTRRSYTREFKAEAVRLVNDQGLSCAEAARDLGLHPSVLFQRLLELHGIECSLSRRGDCWDNAAMESFFSSLKSERLNRRTYRKRDDVRADVFSYIEQFYNPRRRHSTLGYVSPMEYEKQAGFA